MSFPAFGGTHLHSLPTESISFRFSRAPKPWDHSYELPTEFRHDEDPEQLRAEGEALTLLYLDQYCPSIEPHAVKLKVEGRIGGVHVKSLIDLLDADGRKNAG